MWNKSCKAACAAPAMHVTGVPRCNSIFRGDVAIMQPFIIYATNFVIFLIQLCYYRSFPS